MFNRSRSRHGVSRKGSSASLNLTAAKLKKKAVVQMYIKYYWDVKVKQR